jgi:hypothetical protein
MSIKLAFVVLSKMCPVSVLLWLRAPQLYRTESLHCQPSREIFPARGQIKCETAAQRVGSVAKLVGTVVKMAL